MLLSYIFVIYLFVRPGFSADNASIDISSMSCDQAKKSKILAACCNIPRDDRMSKSCRQYLLSQNKTTTNNGESRNLKADKVARHACIAECVFKQNGYLQSDGSINLQAVQKSLQQRYNNDPSVSQIMFTSLNSCMESSQRRSKQFEWMHSKDNCDYYPATLLACTMDKVYKNCPATKWKNTDKCIAIKKLLSSCDNAKK